jgi:hypothetical protein
MMAHDQPQTAPYGMWQSPLKADLLASDSMSLYQAEIDVHTVIFLFLTLSANNSIAGSFRENILSGGKTYRKWTLLYRRVFSEWTCERCASSAIQRHDKSS